MHTVKRIFGGFAVVDAEGVEIRTYKGKGAKAKAVNYALRDETGESVESTGGRGNHGRGGRGRGNF